MKTDRSIIKTHTAVQQPVLHPFKAATGLARGTVPTIHAMKLKSRLRYILEEMYMRAAIVRILIFDSLGFALIFIGGRAKSLCCKPNLDEFTSLTCENGVPSVGEDEADSEGPGAEGSGGEGSETEDSSDAETGNSLSIRSDEGLLRRGAARSSIVLLTKGAKFSKKLILKSRSYPSSKSLFEGHGSSTLGPLIGGFR